MKTILPIILATVLAASAQAQVGGNPAKTNATANLAANSPCPWSPANHHGTRAKYTCTKTVDISQADNLFRDAEGKTCGNPAFWRPPSVAAELVGNKVKFEWYCKRKP